MRLRKLRPYPNLRTWRNDRRWSQAEAADYLGITQSHYSKVERQEIMLTGPKAKAIHDKTGVSFEVLLGLEEVAS